MHKYPQGAIQTEDDLLFHLLGKPLYHVYGLGKQSYLTEMMNVRNLHTVSGGIRLFDFDENRLGYTSSCYLGDCNIGSHHNDHYIFRQRKYAENYLEYAKHNTQCAYI